MTVERKRNRRNKKQNQEQRVIKDKFQEERKTLPPIQAKNDFQKRVLSALATKKVVVINSCAGTGKSFMTMTQAIDSYMRGESDRLFLCRPAVGMGNTLGLLKGDIRQKYEPYLAPLIEVIKARYGHGVYETGLRSGEIILQPFEYLRGMNIDGWAVVDEAQCCSGKELYSVLTRITEQGKLVLLGDRTQSDLKGKDGMTWLKNFVDRHNLHDTVEFIEGDSDDIVRSDFVKSIVKAMESDSDFKTKFEK